ncbi:MAG: PTS transporter subunit EIIC [Bacteriovoracaceae bacterium]|nr:PTS transporter subunit EIIC [Bacteriovoracaceae bacterium]
MKSLFNESFSLMQKLGKSLMVPVSVLPAAGLLVALGRILEDLATTDQVVTSTTLLVVGKLFYSGGLAIFEQLPLIFAIGVAIGFTGGAGVAALAAAVGYFTLTNILKVIGEVRELTLAINTGVFGGIIIGLITAYIYKRFFKTQLPKVLGFFSGKRLVPILAAVAAVFTGIILGLIWPPVQEAIHSFGSNIMSSEFGPAFYAAGKRLLIPVGLHHVYYPPFLYEFGEFVTTAGKVVHGESVRYFAGDATAGRFMAAEFPIMLFGLPAAAYAMYLRAPKDKRTAVGGIMLSAALTSIITGITEPIEFAFIFVAPLLYVFHVGAAFCSGLLTNAFDIHLGYTFSASVIDYVVGFFNQKNSSMLWMVVGPAVAAIYFTAFYTLIPIFNFKTPGRDESLEDDDLQLGQLSTSGKSFEILTALGGAKNILDLDACITRLRLKVTSLPSINKARLKSLGAAGIMTTGDNVQVIFGTESEMLKEEIKQIISNNKKLIMTSPLKGEIIPLSEIPDATFAEKLLGDGVGVIPSEGAVYAPVTGVIAQFFHTHHAFGITTENGSEILVHVGIDTVKMKGEGFTPLVKVGDKVKAGEKLLEFDLDLVKQKAKSHITPVVITNMDNISNFKVMQLGNVSPSDSIIEITTH